MNEKTKITLSANELELVCNKEWILTKQAIIEKVYQLFGTLATSMQRHIAENKGRLPNEAIESSPKISKGENYKGLPYVMLDYPRYFTKESTLAVRTLFWWGNFFSINLHLSGACKEQVKPSLAAGFTSLQRNDYSICVHAEPWHHHFEEDNYLPMSDITFTDFTATLNREPFIKIAKRIPLRQWAEAPIFLADHFRELSNLLRINSPTGERGLLPGIPITGFDL